jgi:protein-disulfide isomerase
MVGRLPGKLQNAWAVPAVAGLFGLIGSVFMTWLLLVALKAECGLCLATHAINLPLVLGIWVLWLAGRRRREPVDVLAAPAAPAPLWKIPVLVLAAGLAIGLSQIRETQMMDAIKSLEAESAALDRFAFAQAKKVDIAIGPDDPVRGPADARHTVVIFSDFQCPYCAQFASLFHEVQKALSPNQDISKAPFRMVFKHYPLNADCNAGRKPLAAIKGIEQHLYSCEAAAAAEAARRLGGNDAFWKMHDLLYANREKLAQQPYKQLAAQIGLDPEKFEEVRQDPQTRERISRDADEATAVGVRTTPSIYLDGKRVERPIKVVDSQNVQAKTIQHWKSLLLWANRPAASTTDPAAAFDEAVRQLGGKPPATAPALPRPRVPATRP